MASYHDVFITTANIPRTSIFNLPYGYTIHCSRVRGWSLWLTQDTARGIVETLVAEEYFAEESEKWLVLDVNGHVILDSRDVDEEKIPGEKNAENA